MTVLTPVVFYKSYNSELSQHVQTYVWGSYARNFGSTVMLIDISEYSGDNIN